MRSLVKLLGGTLAVAVSLAPFEAHSFQLKRSDTITIRHNRGGHMLRFSIRAKKLTKQNRTVRFAGICYSACTMYLSMPSHLTCILPGATFGFHMPYGSTPRGNRIAANYMMKSYPEWVRQWIRANRGLSKNIKTMPYDYARQYMRPCMSGTKLAA